MTDFAHLKRDLTVLALAAVGTFTAIAAATGYLVARLGNRPS